MDFVEALVLRVDLLEREFAVEESVAAVADFVAVVAELVDVVYLVVEVVGLVAVVPDIVAVEERAAEIVAVEERAVDIVADEERAADIVAVEELGHDIVVELVDIVVPELVLAPDFVDTVEDVVGIAVVALAVRDKELVDLAVPHSLEDAFPEGTENRVGKSIARIKKIYFFLYCFCFTHVKNYLQLFFSNFVFNMLLIKIKFYYLQHLNTLLIKLPLAKLYCRSN